MSDSLLEGYLHRRCGGHYVRAAETVTLRYSNWLAANKGLAPSGHGCRSRLVDV